ncbi:MAG TPA: hypothetical protein VFV34_16540, partial [Blastocatellia bacterium]|nr:hypothetical protein [Blastocatellia bacterium]
MHPSKRFGHWPATLFFSASLVTLFLLASCWYNPRDRTWHRTAPVVFSGDEPHYLVIVSSILNDGDLLLGDNYQAARLGDADAGAGFSGRYLDHHTLIRDTLTGDSLLWEKVFTHTRLVECPPGDFACVGFERISDRFPDYTAVNPRYAELPKHPVPYPALIALVLKIIGARHDQIEARAIYVNVFLAWLAGVLAYCCGLKAGLEKRWSLAAVGLLYYASSWLVYSREQFPAVFLGLLLIAALWALLSEWFAVSAALLALASMQSESFVLVLLAWTIWLYLAKERRSVWIFGASGALSIGFVCLINYLLLGSVSIRDTSAGLSQANIWRTFIDPQTGVLLFVPWTIGALGLILVGCFCRNRDVSGFLLLLALGILPVALIYMALPYTGRTCYGPRYWVPYLPWLSLGFV